MAGAEIGRRQLVHFRGVDHPVDSAALLFADSHPSHQVRKALVSGLVTVDVEELVRQKYAATGRARASRGQADKSRNIPAEVKRKVHLRDRGRCAYVAPSERRCGERAFVEFHHIHPYAAGGLPSVENIELRCRAHNQYEAELFFGAGVGLAREAGATYGCVKAPTFSFRNESVSVQPRWAAVTHAAAPLHRGGRISRR